MKRSITLLLFAILMTAGAYAQKGFYIGLGGGVTSVWMTNQQIYGLTQLDYVPTYGWRVGLMAGYEFNSHLGIKTDLGYATGGQKYDGDQHDTVTTRDVKTTYFQIPILFKYRVGSDNAKFYFLIGPQLGILTSATQKYERDWGVAGPPSVNGEPVNQEDISNRISKLDWELRFDLGTDIKLAKPLILNIALSFAYGFSDTNESGWRMEDSDGNYNASHNIFGGLMVGLNYKFGQK
jgi:hypothetical protein